MAVDGIRTYLTQQVAFLMRYKTIFLLLWALEACYHARRMIHFLLPLFLALLPLVVADNLSARIPPHAEQPVKKGCLAFSCPGQGCVAGYGEVMQDVVALHRWMPSARLAVLVAIPANRVMRALNIPKAAAFPPDWYDDKFKPFWAADALIPADRVLELWYAAQECLAVPVSWFCDAAGDNLVIVTGHAANFHAYEMYLYQWNEAEQGFRRRGVFYFGSKEYHLIPSRVKFKPEGMSITAVSPLRPEAAPFYHLFRYADGNTSVRFPDRNQGTL